MTSLTSTANGLLKSVAGASNAPFVSARSARLEDSARSAARSFVCVEVGGVSKLTVDKGASGGRPDTIWTGAGAEAGGRWMSGSMAGDDGRAWVAGSRPR